MTEAHKVTSTGNGAYQADVPPAAEAPPSPTDLLRDQFSDLVKHHIKYNEICHGKNYFKQANPIAQTTTGLKAKIDPDIRVDICYEFHIGNLVALHCHLLDSKDREDFTRQVMVASVRALHSLLDVLLINNSYYEPYATPLLYGGYMSALLLKADYASESLVDLGRMTQLQSLAGKRVVQSFFVFMKRISETHGFTLTDLHKTYMAMHDLEKIPAHETKWFHLE